MCWEMWGPGWAIFLYRISRNSEYSSQIGGDMLENWLTKGSVTEGRKDDGRPIQSEIRHCKSGR